MADRHSRTGFDALRAAASRAANEEIARAAERAGDVVAHIDGVWPFLCECGRTGCSERVEVSVAQYRAAVGARARVAVPDHVAAEDDVVERHDAYIVVR